MEDAGPHAILYDSGLDETASYEAEKQAADAIEVAIETALRSGGKWRDIRLLSCDAVSDSAMTVAKGGLLKRWRLDYMSLADEPQQAILAPDLSPMIALPRACSPCRRRGQKAHPEVSSGRWVVVWRRRELQG